MCSPKTLTVYKQCSCIMFYSSLCPQARPLTISILASTLIMQVCTGRFLSTNILAVFTYWCFFLVLPLFFSAVSILSLFLSSLSICLFLYLTFGQVVLFGFNRYQVHRFYQEFEKLILIRIDIKEINRITYMASNILYVQEVLLGILRFVLFGVKRIKDYKSSHAQFYIDYIYVSLFLCVCVSLSFCLCLSVSLSICLSLSLLHSSRQNIDIYIYKIYILQDKISYQIYLSLIRSD